MQKIPASLVRVKTKYQITIPPRVRQSLRLEEGDLLEITQDGASIRLTPKTLLDKRLTAALQDIAQGKVHGPFRSAKDALKALK